MFLNIERTKFFEFIIPVIPIINSSNSIDMVLEQGRRLSLDKRLDRQFLREVSRFLNDLRLIQNIFNEYAIYTQNLESDEENILDPNKLLAILIYKNVLPRDFEDLHKEKGNLAGILGQHDALIASAEAQYTHQIRELEARMAAADEQLPSTIKELTKIYAMTLVSEMPSNFTHIQGPGNERIPAQSLWNNPNFEQILKEKQITFWSPHSGINRVTVGDIEAEVNSEKSFRERKLEVERKTQDEKDKIYRQIAKLRAKISSLRITEFNKIIQTDPSGVAPLFDRFGENKDLVKFLVMEGFLDDTYYQYTSLFHSGRLSPSDNKFLIQIRAFNNPEPNFQIDNPKEVIAAMRDADFRQNFTLNVTLVDCLLSDPSEYREQLSKMVSYVTENFADCEAFFSAYYEAGKNVSGLLAWMIEEWPEFLSAALKSAYANAHVANLVAHLSGSSLKTLGETVPALLAFFSKRLSGVLAQGIDVDPTRLQLLPFEIELLESVREYPAIVEVLATQGMYKLNLSNIEFIFERVRGAVGIDDLYTRNYSAILEAGGEALIYKVESNFAIYLHDVILCLKENTNESVSAILRVINDNELDEADVLSFLEAQSRELPALHDVPERLHVAVFELHKVEPSWSNCAEFLSSSNFDAGTLTKFLGADGTRRRIFREKINSGKGGFAVRKFLFENNSLSDDHYAQYVRALPRPFSYFPESIDADKLRVIVEEDRVTFSKATFSYLSDYLETQVLFISKHLDTYFKAEEVFDLNDEFRQRIILQNISDAQRLRLVEEMDWTQISSNPARASVIGDLYHRTGADVENFDAETAAAIVINTRPVEVQVSLLNRFKDVLSKDGVRQILNEMPSPFSYIRPGWRRPTLPISDENLALATWLESRGVISSWEKNLTFKEIRIYNFRR